MAMSKLRVSQRKYLKLLIGITAAENRGVRGRN